MKALVFILVGISWRLAYIDHNKQSEVSGKATRSPLLFIVVLEYLSRLTSKAIDQGDLELYTVNGAKVNL